MLAPAHITLRGNGRGYMQFGDLLAELDCEVQYIRGKEQLAFIWKGIELDGPASGSGRVWLRGRDLRGKIERSGKSFGFDAEASAPMPKSPLWRATAQRRKGNRPPTETPHRKIKTRSEEFPPAGNGMTKLGTTDFTDQMYRGVAAWYVVAVEARLDAVAREFALIRKARRLVRNVGVLPARKHEAVGSLIPIIRVRNSLWTVLLPAVHFITQRHLNDYCQDAKELSARLKTRAVAYCAEDTANGMGFVLWDSGRLLEQADFERGSDRCEFKSERRALPPREVYDERFPDEIFRELGIYVPLCVSRKSAKPGIAAHRKAAPMVERAHLIELQP